MVCSYFRLDQMALVIIASSHIQIGNHFDLKLGVFGLYIGI